jgi:hypothetical protein
MLPRAKGSPEFTDAYEASMRFATPELSCPRLAGMPDRSRVASVAATWIEALSRVPTAVVQPIARSVWKG